MKILKALSLALAFFATPALAQNPGTVTQYAFAIGKGAGQTGFTSLLCGSAQLAVGQSAAAPICRTITGDVTITSGGVTAIGAGAVTNTMLAGSIALTKLATQAAYTLNGNATGSAAAPTAFAPSSLTHKVSPASTDIIVIQDQAASGALKYSTLAEAIGALASGVSSANSQTGALTFNGGITNSGTTFSIDAATQSDQETATGTTKPVTSGRQQYHPSAAKAWAYCTQSAGTYTLSASYNISGGTCGKTGTGLLTLTFTTAFSSSSAFGCVGSSSDQIVFFISQNASASTLNIFLKNLSSANTDSGFTVSCFGDQ